MGEFEFKLAGGVTELNQAEKLLRDSEERYRRLFETAKDAILILDSGTGKIIDANPFLTNLLGFTKEEIFGKKLWQIGAFADIRESKAAFEELQQKEYIRYEDLPLKTKDGRLIEVEFISNSYFVDHQKVIQCNIRDITERRKTEKTICDSETRYRRLFESAQDGILILDADTEKITDINPFLQTMLGYSHSDVIGKKLWEIGTFKDISVNQANFIELQNKEYIRYENIPLETKEGKHKQVEFVSNVYLVDGKKVIQCNIRDITERKLVEQKLQHYEIKYRSLTENSPDLIAQFDRQYRHLYVNPAAAKAGRYTPEAYIGKTMVEAGVTEPEARKWEELIRSVFETGQVVDVEDIFETPDGLKHFNTKFVPEFAADGSILSVQSIARDITERKQAEEAVRQMQKLEGLGTLAGGIAHDFNNILGIILAYITNIKRYRDNENKLDNATDIIMKAVQRGKELVRQILTFARKTETKFGPVNINDIVMEIMGMILETFPKVLTYAQNFGKDIPFISADRSQLHQALLNLCVNARDAMPSSGVLTINTYMVSGISLRNLHPDTPASSYVCVEVSDTGEGMSEEIRKHIFEPFFTTKDKGKGTGLGLAVAFGVVQNHKGFIDVESESGKGAIFRLYLPASQVIEPVSIEAEETTEEIPGGTETLLVVEDEENLILPLLTVLVEKGYTVLSADDGSAAMKIYGEHKNEIALVLTDFGLPKVTGMEVCTRIKQLNPDARIIVATGFLDPKMKSEFLKTGVQDFLFKPYHFRRVLKVIRKVLDEKV